VFLHPIQNGGGHPGGHGVAALLRIERGIAAHCVADLAALLGAERSFATAAPGIEQLHFGRRILAAGATVVVLLDACIAHRVLGGQVHDLLVAIDRGIDALDLRHVVVVLGLVVGGPGVAVAGAGVQQVAGFLRQGVTALPLSVQIERHFGSFI